MGAGLSFTQHSQRTQAVQLGARTTFDSEARAGATLGCSNKNVVIATGAPEAIRRNHDVRKAYLGDELAA